jgi:hypothetical protein
MYGSFDIRVRTALASLGRDREIAFKDFSRRSDDVYMDISPSLGYIAGSSK